jgi:predicted  nucleic acid-binding Zn-ribbon protein
MASLPAPSVPITDGGDDDDQWDDLINGPHDQPPPGYESPPIESSSTLPLLPSSSRGGVIWSPLLGTPPRALARTGDAADNKQSIGQPLFGMMRESNLDEAGDLDDPDDPSTPPHTEVVPSTAAGYATPPRARQPRSSIRRDDRVDRNIPQSEPVRQPRSSSSSSLRRMATQSNVVPSTEPRNGPLRGHRLHNDNDDGDDVDDGMDNVPQRQAAATTTTTRAQPNTSSSSHNGVVNNDQLFAEVTRVMLASPPDTPIHDELIPPLPVPHRPSSTSSTPNQITNTNNKATMNGVGTSVSSSRAKLSSATWPPPPQSSTSSSSSSSSSMLTHQTLSPFRGFDGRLPVPSSNTHSSTPLTLSHHTTGGIRPFSDGLDVLLNATEPSLTWDDLRRIISQLRVKLDTSNQECNEQRKHVHGMHIQFRELELQMNQLQQQIDDVQEVCMFIRDTKLAAMIGVPPTIGDHDIDHQQPILHDVALITHSNGDHEHGGKDNNAAIRVRSKLSTSMTRMDDTTKSIGLGNILNALRGRALQQQMMNKSELNLRHATDQQMIHELNIQLRQENDHRLASERAHEHELQRLRDEVAVQSTRCRQLEMEKDQSDDALAYHENHKSARVTAEMERRTAETKLLKEINDRDETLRQIQEQYNEATTTITQLQQQILELQQRPRTPPPSLLQTVAEEPHNAVAAATTPSLAAYATLSAQAAKAEVLERQVVATKQELATLTRGYKMLETRLQSFESTTTTTTMMTSSTSGATNDPNYKDNDNNNNNSHDQQSNSIRVLEERISKLQRELATKTESIDELSSDNKRLHDEQLKMIDQLQQYTATSSTTTSTTIDIDTYTSERALWKRQMDEQLEEHDRVINDLRNEAQHQLIDERNHIIAQQQIEYKESMVLLERQWQQTEQARLLQQEHDMELLRKQLHDYKHQIHTLETRIPDMDTEHQKQLAIKQKMIDDANEATRTASSLSSKDMTDQLVQLQASSQVARSNESARMEEITRLKQLHDEQIKRLNITHEQQLHDLQHQLQLQQLNDATVSRAHKDTTNTEAMASIAATKATAIAAEHRASELDRRLTETRDQLASMTLAHDRLQKQYDERDDEWRTSILTKDHDMDRLRTQVADLRASETVNDKEWQQRMDTLRSDMTTLMERYTKLSNEDTLLREQHERSSTSVTTVPTTVSPVSTAHHQRQIDDLEHRLRTLQRDMHDKDSRHVASTKQWLQHMEDKSNAMATLQQRYDDHRRDCDATISQLRRDAAAAKTSAAIAATVSSFPTGSSSISAADVEQRVTDMQQNHDRSVAHERSSVLAANDRTDRARDRIAELEQLLARTIANATAVKPSTSSPSLLQIPSTPSIIEAPPSPVVIVHNGGHDDDNSEVVKSMQIVADAQVMQIAECETIIKAKDEELIDCHHRIDSLMDQLADEKRRGQHAHVAIDEAKRQAESYQQDAIARQRQLDAFIRASTRTGASLPSNVYIAPSTTTLPPPQLSVPTPIPRSTSSSSVSTLSRGGSSIVPQPQPQSLQLPPAFDTLNVVTSATSTTTTPSIPVGNSQVVASAPMGAASAPATAATTSSLMSPPRFSLAVPPQQRVPMMDTNNTPSVVAMLPSVSTIASSPIRAPLPPPPAFPSHLIDATSSSWLPISPPATPSSLPPVAASSSSSSLISSSPLSLLPSSSVPVGTSPSIYQHTAVTNESSSSLPSHSHQPSSQSSSVVTRLENRFPSPPVVVSSSQVAPAPSSRQHPLALPVYTSPFHSSSPALQQQQQHDPQSTSVASLAAVSRPATPIGTSSNTVVMDASAPVMRWSYTQPMINSNNPPANRSQRPMMMMTSESKTISASLPRIPVIGNMNNSLSSTLPSSSSSLSQSSHQLSLSNTPAPRLPFGGRPINSVIDSSDDDDDIDATTNDGTSANVPTGITRRAVAVTSRLYPAVLSSTAPITKLGSNNNNNAQSRKAALLAEAIHLKNQIAAASGPSSSRQQRSRGNAVTGVSSRTVTQLAHRSGNQPSSLRTNGDGAVGVSQQQQPSSQRDRRSSISSNNNETPSSSQTATTTNIRDGRRVTLAWSDPSPRSTTPSPSSTKDGNRSIFHFHASGTVKQVNTNNRNRSAR